MRPAHAIPPGPGQELVWDYPRPPRRQLSPRHIQVRFNGQIIADTRRALRVVKTSHPPVDDIPPGDIKMEYLKTPTTGPPTASGRAAPAITRLRWATARPGRRLVLSGSRPPATRR